MRKQWLVSKLLLALDVHVHAHTNTREKATHAKRDDQNHLENTIADHVSREVCRANPFYFDLVRHLMVARFIASILAKRRRFRYPKIGTFIMAPYVHRHLWAIKSKIQLNHPEPCHLISPTLAKSPKKSETWWVYIIICSDDQWPYPTYPNIIAVFQG